MNDVVKRILFIRKLGRKLAKIFQDSPKIQKDKSYQKILFCPINAAQVNTIREGLMGKYCDTHGATPVFLYQRQRLSFSFYYNNYISYLFYTIKLAVNKRFIAKIGLKTYTTKKVRFQDQTVTFNKLIKDPDAFESYAYKGIKLGDLILADTIRYLQCFGPMWEDAQFLSLLNKAFVSSIQLFHSYEEAIDSIKPDKIVMSHGIYTLWGIMFRIARQKNIPVDVYGGSYRKNTLRYYHNVPNAPMPMYNWEKLKTKPLNEIEIKTVDDYLKTRATQEEDNISLFKDKGSSKNKALEDFLDEAKKKNGTVCCLFTNIAWDAYAFSGDSIFDGMMDWLLQTIQFFQKNPNAYLIIKSHPAEVYFKVPEQYRIRSFVKEHINWNNIILLDEHSDVKPFDLYHVIDFGIVNISTVSLEMALKNMPVLSSGQGGQYSGKGFTIDPSSRQDYFNNLEQLIDKKSDFKPNIEAAKRYLFFRFFREAIPFDVIDLKNIYSIDHIKFSSSKDFISNKNMELIANGILNDTAFLLSTEHIIEN